MAPRPPTPPPGKGGRRRPVSRDADPDGQGKAAAGEAGAGKAGAGTKADEGDLSDAETLIGDEKQNAEIMAEEK